MSYIEMGDIGKMRIGHGYDTHRLAEDRDLILGGVNIPYAKGLAGHSDADAVIHALCDALLGAMGLGDIGGHFPDSDHEFTDIDSRILLRRVYDLMETGHLALANADITILAQAPKMAPHLSTMIANISSDLHVDNTKVNIKASTTEHMGFVGRGEGIVAYAVVLLVAS